MAHPLVNVTRWSALGLGILYGFFHNRSLYKLEEKRAADAIYQHKADLIEKARTEWAKKKATESGGVITDLDSPNFDFEKLINSLDEQK